MTEPEYDRATWLKPFPAASGAHQRIHAITTGRLVGKELNIRRPPVKLTIAANSEFTLVIHPKLGSSPTGWVIDDIPIKLVTRVNSLTELTARLWTNDSLHLTRWNRNDHRNAAAIALMLATLNRFVANPLKAIADDATHCGFCGRALKDAKSREWGIGPECRREFEVAIRLDDGAMDQPASIHFQHQIDQQLQTRT